MRSHVDATIQGLPTREGVSENKGIMESELRYKHNNGKKRKGGKRKGSSIELVKN